MNNFNSLKDASLVLLGFLVHLIQLNQSPPPLSRDHLRCFVFITSKTIAFLLRFGNGNENY